MIFVLTKNCNDEPVYGIEINGMTIYNPHISECGRFPVDPLKVYGLDKKTVEALAKINMANNYCTEC
jgi:hypothetical protein